MRNFLISYSATFLTFISCSTVRNSQEELIAMELKRSKAIELHDSRTLSKMYADDFSGVAAGGLRVTKPILMNIFSKHNNEFIFVNDDHRVRFVDKRTAILTGRLTSKDRNNNVINISRYSHVLAWRNGRWQIIYGQGTVIPINVEQ